MGSILEERWSPQFRKRQELMRTLETPTISETKENVGLPLALVLYEECHPDLKKDYGLEPPLRGPTGDLWVSPSDLLIGKVALTPPLTQKHIQALTHQGIIDLGTEIEQKFLNEMRIERENAVREREEHLRMMFDAQLEVLLWEKIEEERKKHDEEMGEMRSFFGNKISELVYGCGKQVGQLEEEMQIEYDSLNVLWQEHLEQEIAVTVQRITEEFLEKLRRQEQALLSIFTKQIRRLKTKNKCAIDFERRKCREMIIQMKHKLHCENIANLMYLLCKERRKCKAEKRAILDDYKAQIRKHLRTIGKKCNIIRKLRQIKNRREKQLNVRERCLKEILRQFQKFIYFALKAAPTQGEFLLNINRLVKWHLDDYCIEEEAIPQTITDKVIEEKPIIKEPDRGVQIADFLQASKSSSDEEEYGDVLPAFYFNDKMYVREDFRDRFEAGIEIDRKNSLWNPDVEELLNIFKQSINSKRTNQTENIKSHSSNVRFHPGGSSTDSSEISSVSAHILTIFPDPTPPGTPTLSDAQKFPVSSSAQPRQSNIMPPKKIPSFDEEQEEKEIRRVSLGTPIPQSPKEAKDSGSFGVRSVIEPSALTQSRLTLARDSIILHISNVERKSLQLISKNAEGTLSRDPSKTSKHLEEREVELDTEKDNEEEQSYIKKSLESQDSLVSDQPKSKPTSRLTLANDSYELIKSTIALVSDREKDKPPEKERQKSQLTFTMEPTAQVPLALSTAKTTPKPKQILKRKTPHGSVKASAAKVVGSRKTKEHEKTIDEFTNERIKSLVSMMKESPSLIRLFTPCLK